DDDDGDGGGEGDARNGGTAAAKPAALKTTSNKPKATPATTKATPSSLLSFAADEEGEGDDGGPFGMAVAIGGRSKPSSKESKAKSRSAGFGTGHGEGHRVNRDKKGREERKGREEKREGGKGGGGVVVGGPSAGGALNVMPQSGEYTKEKLAELARNTMRIAAPSSASRRTPHPPSASIAAAGAALSASAAPSSTVTPPSLSEPLIVLRGSLKPAGSAAAEAEAGASGSGAAGSAGSDRSDMAGLGSMRGVEDEMGEEEGEKGKGEQSSEDEEEALGGRVALGGVLGGDRGSGRARGGKGRGGSGEVNGERRGRGMGEDEEGEEEEREKEAEEDEEERRWEEEQLRKGVGRMVSMPGATGGKDGGVGAKTGGEKGGGVGAMGGGGEEGGRSASEVFSGGMRAGAWGYGGAGGMGGAGSIVAEGDEVMKFLREGLARLQLPINLLHTTPVHPKPHSPPLYTMLHHTLNSSMPPRTTLSPPLHTVLHHSPLSITRTSPHTIPTPLHATPSLCPQASQSKAEQEAREAEDRLVAAADEVLELERAMKGAEGKYRFVQDLRQYVAVLCDFLKVRLAPGGF
ncbi:unnamed protein product, partial [Closterium sp. NIES-54]